ncbi:hypothetical protein QJS04_geneDACA011041 [Acorus gramineus]|uniref:Uncharacterized protein n=1 Tax=Acorus gramineus TaxID=55184 RepID=A0AAV9BHY3_ACOGR|nr:hypothetical protein QJS04_geneDACA011041 [Acorus gramineus]
MTRSSRHKSHRQHKHKDRSDSEEDVGGSRDRKVVSEGPPATAAMEVRVSRDMVSERRKSLVKDPVMVGNGDLCNGDRGKKRKDRTDLVVVERWNGGEGGGEKESLKKEALGSDLEKGAKQKLSGVELKGRSGRRDDEDETEEVRKSGKSDLKRKLGRREEIGQQYSKDDRDKERGSEKEKRVSDSQQERLIDDGGGEGRMRRGGSKEENPSKRDVENNEQQADLRNPELEKELEKRIRRRRDGSGDKDKWQGDARDDDDRRISSRDDHAKNGKFKDDLYKDEKYSDKYHEVVDKFQIQREDRDWNRRHRDDRGRENKDREEHDRDRRHREEYDKDRRHHAEHDRDRRHREEHDRDHRHHEEHDRDHRHREDYDREQRHREENHRRREDLDRDHRRREDHNRDHRHREDLYRDQRRREDLNRDNRRREDHDRDKRHREERVRDRRHREDLEWDQRRRNDVDQDQRHREDLDRGQRMRDSKLRDERSSRDYVGNKSDNFHNDDNESSESLHKKAKLQDDHDGMLYVDGQGTRYRENRGRKSSSDEKEDHFDLNSPSDKGQHIDAENTEVSSKLIYNTERERSEISDTGDYKRNAQLKSSPATSVNTVKDQDRHHSRQAELSREDSISEERRHQSATFTEDHSGTLGGFDSQQLGKSKSNNVGVSGELLMENNSTPRHGRAMSRSDGRASPNRLTDKSPSSTSDQRCSNKSNARRNLNVEEIGQRSISLKDSAPGGSSLDERGRELPVENPASDELSQSELPNESIPASSSSFIRAGFFPNDSPGHLPPPLTPMSHGIDSPSVFGSFDEDTRSQAGDRKSNNRYKRSGDLNTGRGQSWKGVPNWPPPLANGFLPFLHGPPPGGFHPVQQFAATSLFGVRASMDLNHTGVSYHMHEADRFSGHGQPFGWRTQADEHMHGWDGSNGVFGDEAHVYGRPDWDQNRHLMSNRGWEMSTEMWKAQNGNINMKFSTRQEESVHSAHISADEGWTVQAGHHQRIERGQPDRLPAENIEIMRSTDVPSMKNITESSPALDAEKKSETTDVSENSPDDSPPFWSAYLSKLDISLDLALPDLYEQCVCLLDKDDSAGDSNVSNHVSSEDKKFRATAALISYFFPSNTDAVFQRAMSLYKRQNEKTSGRRVEEPYSTTSKKVDNVEVQISPEHTSLPGISSSSEKCSPPGDAPEQQSIDVTDVVGPEISKTSEALMPDLIDCRLNLSRIHPSFESTH